jgi:hypothetical protein
MQTEEEFYRDVSGLYAIWQRSRETGRITAEAILRHGVYQRGKIIQHECRVLHRQPVPIVNIQREFKALREQFGPPKLRHDGLLRIVAEWFRGDIVDIQRTVERNI